VKQPRGIGCQPTAAPYLYVVSGTTSATLTDMLCLGHDRRGDFSAAHSVEQCDGSRRNYRSVQHSTVTGNGVYVAHR